MLQWKPQFYTVLVFVALVVIAMVLAGLEDIGSQFGW
jgi:hypothetical protein